MTLQDKLKRSPSVRRPEREDTWYLSLAVMITAQVIAVAVTILLWK